MIHVTNQPPPFIIKSIISLWELKKIQPMIATAKIVGYMRFMRLLYQSGKYLTPAIGFKNNVKPEQKKNSTSPIAPPVARKLYFPYSNSMCEFVISMAARHFRMSILIFLSFIFLCLFL